MVLIYRVISRYKLKCYTQERGVVLFLIVPDPTINILLSFVKNIFTI